jgi:hypothetical protein
MSYFSKLPEKKAITQFYKALKNLSEDISDRINYKSQ